MSTKQSQIFNSKQEMLNELAERVTQPTNFAQVKYNVGKKKFTSYVSTETLKSSRNFSYENSDYVDNGVVVRLNLPEEKYLYDKISKRFGYETRHGSLQEQLAASHSVTDYRKNVQIPYWIKTGEVIRKSDNKAEVRRIESGSFGKVKISVPDILVETKNGKQLNANIETSSEKIVPRMELGPILQKTIPTKTGYYSKLLGVIPADSELVEKNQSSIGYFGNIYFDKNNLASVRSGWGSDYGVLYAYAYGLLIRGDGGALGVWTDENPKK